MPVFVANSSYRRMLFRGCVIAALSGVVLVCALFFIEIVRPTNRAPISQASTEEKYLFYFSPVNYKKVALTFDDGPTKEATESIIAVLQKYHVPATFFLIGGNVLKHPAIARDVADAGFAIGNHSFTHSTEVHSSKRRLSLELSAAEAVIRDVTGVVPEYYRPPYLLSIGIDPVPNPYIPDDAGNLWAMSLGYLPVGIDIDTLDWAAHTSQQIFQNFKSQFRGGEHRIALLHDVPYTDEAMDEVIPWLLDQGFKIVPLSALLEPPTTIELTKDLAFGDTVESKGEEVGLLQWFLYTQGYLDPYAMSGAFDQNTADALLTFEIDQNLIDPTALDQSAPVLTAATRERILALTASVPASTPAGVTPLTHAAFVIERAGVYAYSVAAKGVVLLAKFALALIGVRVLLLVVLLAAGRLRTSKDEAVPLSGALRASVLIPAYNEEENIRSAIESVLRNSYRNREIIIISDGSTDRTEAVVREVIARNPKESIKLLSVENGGKARALNLGAAEATGDVLIVLDGDAALEENAIAYMVRHFKDERVGAVAGKVETAKERTPLSIFQSLEYAMGQNIDKRAFSVVRAVGIVPGPAGAWRATLVRALGGFPGDTLVEDQDMTLSVLRAGFDVLYEPLAVSYTETPRTVHNFLKQRFRWVYGTIQCFWKHKGVFIERPFSAMSLLVMPNTLLFSILLPVTYPIVDTVLIFGLILGASATLLTPIIIFTIIDMLYAIWGAWHERDGQILVLFVPLQRIFYRQLLYYTVIRSLVRAVEGRGAGWNKFAKHGYTQQFYLATIATPAPKEAARSL